VPVRFKKIHRFITKNKSCDQSAERGFKVGKKQALLKY